MSLRRDTMYNLSGSLAPMAVALLTIPLLLRRVGDVRFGVLALVSLLLGHFAVFDFGLSRATARWIAALAPDDTAGRRRVFWTSVWMNVGFGLLGTAALFVLAEPLMSRVFRLEDTARAEVMTALPWIAAGVPLATLAGVLAGALDGRQRFDIANGVQAAGAVIGQVTLVVAAWAISPQLGVLIPATVLARAFSVLLLLGASVWYVAPGRPLPPDRARARELLGFGAWMSVFALITPFFMTLDKFVLGAVAGAAAVAYYAIPDQLVRRLSVLPLAVARTMFSRIPASDAATSRDLSARSANVLIAAVTPTVVVLVVAMRPFLAVWIDSAFAARAAVPGILLAGVIWLNSLAMIPSVYLQASGRPDVTAKLALLEILPHAAVLWASIRAFGAAGAAAAVLILTIVDAGVLMVLAALPLWRTRPFWQGVAWVAVASAIGLGDYALEPWRYGAALAAVAGAATWALRTSPDLSRTAATLLGRIPALRRGART
jgi:O-antigen/teichoic acid export membrane protein